MSHIFEDMEKPFLPVLILNWIFGIGIIQYPIRKPHRIISCIYTLIILAIYGFLTWKTYPSYVESGAAKKTPRMERMFFFLNFIVTVSVLISGWFQTKVIFYVITLLFYDFEWKEAAHVIQF